VSFSEIPDYTDKVIGIVAFSGHQMSAAEIDPFEFGQESAELFFEMGERSFEILAAAFAQDMEVEPFYTVGEPAFATFRLSSPSREPADAGLYRNPF
jgi:hypothetical protein